MNKESSRTKNSFKNIITGLSNKVLILILAFISRKLFIQYIGVEYLGINSLFSNVFSLLSMADLGFGVAMAYSYYKPLAEGDKKRLQALTSFYNRVYNLIALTVAVIGCCLIPFLKYIVNLDRDIPHLYLIYLITLTNTVVSYLFVYKATLINADQKSFLVNKINIYVGIVKTILQCVFIIVFKNYLAYVILEAVATIANNLIASAVADRTYPYLKVKEELTAIEKKNIYSNMRSVFLYKASASLMGGTDSIIMSKICGTVVVGFYSNYLTVTNQLTAFVQIFFSSLTASVGNLLVQKDEKKNYLVFKQMQMISHWMSATVSLCVLVLVQDLIQLWLGNEYLMEMNMIYAVSLNLYFTIAMQPIWSYREASGLYTKTKYVMLCTVAVNIGLSIIMGIYFDAAGVIYATVIARLVTYFWYEPTLIFKLYFRKSSVVYYVDFLISLLLIVGSHFLINIISKQIGISSASWVNLILKGMISVGIISLAYLARYFWTNEFKIFCSKVMRNLKQKVVK